MSARRLLIWRHGRTEWNSIGRIQGQADVDLDEVGWGQAQQAAPLLAAEKPDLIVSSDLLRTRRTATALAEITGQPVRFDQRLRERDFGPWQGLTSTELMQQYPQEYEVWRAGEQPEVAGIETEDELSARMLEGVDDALAATEGTVCLVTHGGAARRALLGLLGWPVEAIRQLMPLDNCHWGDLRHSTRRGWRIYSYNIGFGEKIADLQSRPSITDVEPGPAEETAAVPLQSSHN